MQLKCQLSKVKHFRGSCRSGHVVPVLPTIEQGLRWYKNNVEPTELKPGFAEYCYVHKPRVQDLVIYHFTNGHSPLHLGYLRPITY